MLPAIPLHRHMEHLSAFQTVNHRLEILHGQMLHVTVQRNGREQYKELQFSVLSTFVIISPLWIPTLYAGPSVQMWTAVHFWSIQPGS